MQRFGRVYDSVALHRLAPRARAMRIGPTRSEDLLWQVLRRGALGVRFRRQVVLGPFIVDFFAPSVGLVVEVDGGVHLARRDADRLRDEGLRGLGLRVLRIEASVVEQDVHVAVALVRAALG
jgi:very-short-patch-repair endonuclease